MYMQELNALLVAVPQSLRDEWLYDYEMHFRLAVQNGQSEEQAALELGDPRMIASELMLNYRVHQAEERSSVVSVTRAVIATVSLGFFNLVFVLGPFIALMGVLIAFWAVTAALLIAAAASVVEGVRGSAVSLPQGISLAAALTGLGLLAGTGTLYVTRGFFAMTLKYLKFNTRFIKER
jgi:uncharacterized membrane protein